MNAQPQHMNALAKAQRVRLGMATVKKQISAGEIPLASLFDPETTGDLAVGELLRSLPRFGTTRARSFLSSIKEGGRTMRALETVKIRDLTIRERGLLTDACAETSTIATHLRQEN